MPTPLSPTQQQTFDSFLASWPLGNIFSIAADTGMGKTTLLRAAHERLSGAFLGMRELTESMASRHPLALEEAFDQLVRTALTHHSHVFIDDLHLLGGITSGCGAYPRSGYFNAVLESLAGQTV